MILLNLEQPCRVPPSSFVASASEVTNIRRLLSVLAAKEDELRGTRFLAPCVRGEEVTVRGGGLIYSFRPEPKDFEGWGVFEPTDETTACLVEEARPRQVEAYLKQFRQIRLRLAYHMEGQTWLAHPVNEADVQQRLGRRDSQPVHLVNQAAQFEQILARWDGAAYWFEEVDRRADPMHVEKMREALRNKTTPVHLGWKGCTPEMRGCYVQAYRARKGYRQDFRYPSDEQRLRTALAFSGGELCNFFEHEDSWEVVWTTPGGYSYTSLISKRDLTVIDAGFCLSGQDSDFDLQSLVTVAEAGGDYW